MIVKNIEQREKNIYLIQLLAVLTLFLLAYYDTIISVIRGWFTSEGAHGILIFGISIYMVWISKQKLIQSGATPNIILGTILLICSGMILFAGKLTITLILQEISLILSLMALVLLLLGNDYFKILWLPIAYLSFMFPLYEKLLDPVSIYFQRSAIWFASIALSVLKIPYLIQDTFIYLSNINLEVTRACSGITHIIALSSLVIFWCYVNRSSKKVTTVLLLSAFVTGIILNGIRITAICVWSYYSGGQFSHGPFDIFYTSFIFIAGFVLLIVANTIRGLMKREELQVKPILVSVAPAPIWNMKKFSNLSFLATISVLTITILFFNFYKPIPFESQKDLKGFPLLIGEWYGEEIAVSNRIFEKSDADVLLKRVYRNRGGDEVEVYISYFKNADEGRGINNPDYEWFNYRGELVTINSAISEKVIVKRSTYNANENQYRTYFWYTIDKRKMPNRSAAKLALAANAIFERKTNYAMVIVACKLPISVAAEKELSKFIMSVTQNIEEYI